MPYKYKPSMIKHARKKIGEMFKITKDKEERAEKMKEIWEETKKEYKK